MHVCMFLHGRTADGPQRIIKSQIVLGIMCSNNNFKERPFFFPFKKNLLIKPLCVLVRVSGEMQCKKQTEIERRNENKGVFIRHLKNKIIRLVDSKCQLEMGSRWGG